MKASGPATTAPHFAGQSATRWNRHGAEERGAHRGRNALDPRRLHVRLLRALLPGRSCYEHRAVARSDPFEGRAWHPTGSRRRPVTTTQVCVRASAAPEQAHEWLSDRRRPNMCSSHEHLTTNTRSCQGVEKWSPGHRRAGVYHPAPAPLWPLSTSGGRRADEGQMEDRRRADGGRTNRCLPSLRHRCNVSRTLVRGLPA
jgi:hypothetical protein